MRVSNRSASSMSVRHAVFSPQSMAGWDGRSLSGRVLAALSLLCFEGTTDFWVTGLAAFAMPQPDPAIRVSQRSRKPLVQNLCKHLCNRCQHRNQGPGRRDETPGRSNLRDCCETLARLLARPLRYSSPMLPAMTEPETEAPTGNAPRRNAKQHASREVNRSPCQQSVENPVSKVSSTVETPFAPAVEMNDSEPTGCFP
jgi:hypothetical protein